MKKQFNFQLAIIFVIILCSIKGVAQKCGFGPIFQNHIEQNPNLLEHVWKFSFTLI